MVYPLNSIRPFSKRTLIQGNPGEPGNPSIDPGYPGEPGEPGIDPGSIDNSSYSDCAKCLSILFNKIWNGDFPSDWNTASIISIPKKGDLTDCLY